MNSEACSSFRLGLASSYLTFVKSASYCS